jgi:aromatic ring-cleaving dioxygenase
MSEQPIEAITGYHAHVYYDAATRNAAAQVREAMEERFEVQMGRWRDEPVGPHPQSMYQVAFSPSEFARVVPWLALNRAGLVVFIHPNTGDDYADHAVHPLWLGEKLVLKLDVFDRTE